MAVVQTFKLLLRGFEVLAGFFQLPGFQGRVQLVQGLSQGVGQLFLLLCVRLHWFGGAGFAGDAVESLEQGGASEVLWPLYRFEYFPGFLGSWLFLRLAFGSVLQRANLLFVLAEAFDCGYVGPQRLHQVFIGLLFMLVDRSLPGGFQPAVFLGFLQCIKRSKGRLKVRILLFQFIQGVFEKGQGFRPLAALFLLLPELIFFCLHQAEALPDPMYCLEEIGGLFLGGPGFHFCPFLQQCFKPGFIQFCIVTAGLIGRVAYQRLYGFGLLALLLFFITDKLELLAYRLINPLVLSLGKLLYPLQGCFVGKGCGCFNTDAGGHPAGCQFFKLAGGRRGLQNFDLLLTPVILPVYLFQIFRRWFPSTRRRGRCSCLASSEQFLDECSHGGIL